MQERIPDINVPSRYIERMEHSSDPEQTGLEIAVDLIRKIKDLRVVSGVHLMSVGWESVLPRLIREAGLAEGERG